jgi:hypothetical protein
VYLTVNLKVVVIGGIKTDFNDDSFVRVFNGSGFLSNNQSNYFQQKYKSDNIMNDACLISLPKSNAVVITGGSLLTGYAFCSTCQGTLTEGKGLIQLTSSPK